MKAREFCYWLQGYFELTGDAGNRSPVTLGATAIQCIKAHLALVKELDADHANVFVAWLTLRIGIATELGAMDTAEVRRMLGAQFKHEIDPSYKGDPVKLQAIHGGEGPTLYRC